MEFDIPTNIADSLRRAANVVEKNLKDVLDAYSKRDKDIAYRVWNSDLEIDKLVNFSMDELLKFMKSNKKI